MLFLLARYSPPISGVILRQQLSIHAAYSDPRPGISGGYFILSIQDNLYFTNQIHERGGAVWFVSCTWSVSPIWARMKYRRGRGGQIPTDRNLNDRRGSTIYALPILGNKTCSEHLK